MQRKITRRYALGKKDKEIIEAWLNDEISVAEAAAHFGKKGDDFKGMVALMLKQMVSSGELDVSEALKHY